MTNKKRIEMLKKWAKELNHKAEIEHADGRLGNLVAIVTPFGTGRKVWTDFMKPSELEKCLAMYFDNNFKKIVNA